MHISQGDLQLNEVDNVYQDNHTRISGPRPNNGPKIVSQSPANSDINEKVDIEELYVS